jgi:hypothetical protein
MMGPVSVELSFHATYPLTESAMAALEDKARVLARAGDAAVLRGGDDPALVRGVRVLEAAAVPTDAILRDLEDFARSLTLGGPEAGLGWS